MSLNQFMPYALVKKVGEGVEGLFCHRTFLMQSAEEAVKHFYIMLYYLNYICCIKVFNIIDCEFLQLKYFWYFCQLVI